jgi:hypothetical protein
MQMRRRLRHYLARIMARVSLERAWEFQVAGAGLVALASLLGYAVYAG